MRRILILDDDRETCGFIAELIARSDRECVSSHEPDDAIEKIRRERFDLLISDINLNARESGLDLLRAFKTAHPAGQVVLISGFGTLETAIDAVRAGAFDYISKPFNIAEVKTIVDRALSQADRGSDASLPETPPAGLIGRTAPMLEVFKQIAHAADSAAPVLIEGESGTGKELVARAIHTHSPRSREPFVAINCGAIAETLLESELFGHTRGAFTGAIADSKGVFEQAGSGTLLLDEIGETSAALQVKLLRTLEQAEVRPVGASRVLRSNARVLAATNASLEQAVAAGRFRQDLFYRLSVIVIRVPPLRERSADIPLLLSRFLERASARANRRVRLSADALEMLRRYSWPGNVRELQNTIERLVVFSRGNTIEPADLPAQMQQPRPHVPDRLFEDLPTLEELERRYLVHVLDTVSSRTRAAEILGIDRRTLYRMAERFHIELKE
jgi:DNA-binding NtrC family response regulator